MIFKCVFAHLAYVKDRITDHRIGWTSKNLTSVIDGPGLQQLLDAITTYYRQELIEDVLDYD